MRVKFTLLILIYASYLSAQPAESFKVIITGNCYGNAQPKKMEMGLTGEAEGLNVQSGNKNTGSSKIVLRCYRSRTRHGQPMLIVDGVVENLSFISKMNPNDIESVEVMKSAVAMAIFGYDGENGALVVTTKKGPGDVIIIKDFLDGNRIAGATVTFISADKKDTAMYVADEKGEVIVNKKKRGTHVVHVSAVGYRSYEKNYVKKNVIEQHEILLSPEVKTCDEVIISSGSWFSRCYRSGDCFKTTKCEYRIIEKRPDSISGRMDLQTKPMSLKVYPNPLARGNSLHVELNSAQGNANTVRILTIDGRTLFQQNIVKGSTVQKVQMDTRWTAGVYFLQVIYENGMLGASEKIIIQ